MAQSNHTPRLAYTEEALTVLFCLVDEAYAPLNPRGAHSYESIKRLSDSQVIALALFQQLRGVESERSFLRDAERFFSHLFPGVAGLYPSSFNRRVRKLRRFLEPLLREILPELIGEPETLLVDSTLLEVLHPRQVSQQSAGFAGAAWVRRGPFSVLRREAAPVVCFQPGASLLRAHSSQRRGHLPYRRTHQRGGFGGWSSEEALEGPGLQQRGTEEDLGRGWHPFGDRKLRAAAWSEAAHRDRPFEPQEGLRAGRDFGHHAHRAGYQDRGEDLRLHLRFSGQQSVGALSRSHQGVVGMILTTDI